MKKRKLRINLKGFIIVFTIILLSVLVFFFYRNLKVKNIYVKGNSILKEYEIINLSGLEDYPYLYKVSISNIEKKLKTNEFINDVKIKKTLFGKIIIDIDEKKVLYQDIDGKYVLSDNSKIEMDEEITFVPTLINKCEDYCEKLNKKFIIIDKDIVKRISEIEYKPNDLDKERFLFYMSDGNYVYVTLSKLNLINSYNEIYPTLEGKKGILYLDSGNHFEIKKGIE